MKQLLAGVAASAFMTLSPIPQLSIFDIAPAYSQEAEVRISVFFDNLREHGSWVSHPQYRYVWVPTNVGSGWKPYSNGHWVYTDRYGWYFVSDEPFAWAVYHYGRWGYDPDLGWFWVPGTRWAPAWVSWRRGGDHVGWAPLPPEGEGYVVSVEVTAAEPPPGYWVFVPVNAFTAPDLTTVIVEHDEVPVIYEQTEVLGPVTVEQNIVVNNVIEVNFIQERADHEVTVMDVQEVQDPTQAAEADTLAAFTGEIAVEEQAAPSEAVEPTQVEAPTEGQEIEAGAGAETAPADDATETDTEAAPVEEEAPSGEEPADTPEAEEPAAEDAAPEETAPANGEAAEEAPTEEPAEGEAPAEEPGAETPDEETPTAEEPAEPAPAEEAPAAEQQTEEPPAEEPAEAPAEEPAAEPAPAEEAPAEEPAAEQPAEEPAAEQPAEEEAAPEAPEEPSEPQAPAEGEGQAPAEDCPPEMQQAGEC